MAQPWMTRELAGLEVDFTHANIDNSYNTCNKLRNKSKIPDAAKENNLAPIQASNNAHDGEAATPSNLCSPPSDSIELIILSDASQSFTTMWCYLHYLWNWFIDYFDDPVPDGAVIYNGDVPCQYNKKEGMYTEFLGNPKNWCFSSL